MIQVSAAKRRKLERLRSLIAAGELDQRQEDWLAAELLLAWNDLDLADRMDARDRVRLRAIVHRLERAL